MENKTQKTKKKGWKVLIIIAVIVVAIPLIFNAALDIHPKLLIGLFQGYQNQNSFEPRNKAVSSRHIKENGIVYLNDIQYAYGYPNSYLDISYPTESLMQ